MFNEFLLKCAPQAVCWYARLAISLSFRKGAQIEKCTIIYKNCYSCKRLGERSDVSMHNNFVSDSCTDVCLCSWTVHLFLFACMYVLLFSVILFLSLMIYLLLFIEMFLVEDTNPPHHTLGVFCILPHWFVAGKKRLFGCCWIFLQLLSVDQWTSSLHSITNICTTLEYKSMAPCVLVHSHLALCCFFWEWWGFGRCCDFSWCKLRVLIAVELSR